MSKPSLEAARWATDGTNNTAPSSGQRNTGWTVGQDGVSSYDNAIKKAIYDWLVYLNSTGVAPVVTEGGYPARIYTPNGLTAPDITEQEPTGSNPTNLNYYEIDSPDLSTRQFRVNIPNKSGHKLTKFTLRTFATCTLMIEIYKQVTDGTSAPALLALSGPTAVSESTWTDHAVTVDSGEMDGSFNCFALVTMAANVGSNLCYVCHEEREYTAV